MKSVEFQEGSTYCIRKLGAGNTDDCVGRPAQCTRKALVGFLAEVFRGRTFRLFVFGHHNSQRTKTHEQQRVIHFKIICTVWEKKQEKLLLNKKH